MEWEKMLSVILPVKNEPNLGPFLSTVHEVLADIPDSYEIIIVQGDRETKNYPYPQFPHQRTVWTYGDSLERSILGGFSHASEDKIIVMDADGSHPPSNLPQMWQLLNEYEMVVGSRFIKGSNFESGAFRRFITWLTKIAAREAGSKLSDPMSGFFGIRKEVLKRVKFRPLAWKIALEIELRAEPSIKEIPISFVERTMGKSKTNLKIGLRLLWQLQTEGWRRLLS